MLKMMFLARSYEMSRTPFAAREGRSSSFLTLCLVDTPTWRPKGAEQIVRTSVMNPNSISFKRGGGNMDYQISWFDSKIYSGLRPAFSREISSFP
jgi:hypothetical protein